MGKGKRIREQKNREKEAATVAVIVGEANGQPRVKYVITDDIDAYLSSNECVFKNSVDALGLTENERWAFDHGQGYGFLQLAWTMFLQHGETAGIRSCKENAVDKDYLKSFVEPVLNDTVVSPLSSPVEFEQLEQVKEEFRKLING